MDPTQDKEGAKLVVRRLYRPEDVSTDEGYRAGFYDVFASNDEATLTPEDIVGRVEVALPGSTLGKYLHAWHCGIHEHEWPPLTAYQHIYLWQQGVLSRKMWIPMRPDCQYRIVLDSLACCTCQQGLSMWRIH